MLFLFYYFALYLTPVRPTVAVDLTQNRRLPVSIAVYLVPETFGVYLTHIWQNPFNSCCESDAVRQTVAVYLMQPVTFAVYLPQYV